MNIVSGFQSALTGINKGMSALQQDAKVIASQGSTDSLADNDVTTAIVDLTASSQQVEASAKVLSAQDKMLGSLLDEMA